MATVATPYGFRAIQAIGGRPFNGGTIREITMAANNSAAIFNGDLVVLSAAGQPSAVSATPVAGTTAGIVGVCVGASYVTPEGQVTYNHFVPANLVTGGATEVKVLVMDDPAALFQIKGSAALGTFNSGTSGSGWPGAIGKNAAIGFEGGITRTGNSGVNLIVGTNGASLAATATLAVRIVDIVKGTESDPYPEFIVKYNVGVHAYDRALGV